MNSKTLNRRYNTLLRDISIHPHKDELLNLMLTQIRDDVDTVSIISRSTDQVTNF